MLVFILMGAVSASENVTDSSTNNNAVTGDVLASPDNSQASSVADSNKNVGNVTNVTKNNNSNLLTSPNNGGGSVLGAPDDSFTALQALINAASGSTVTLNKNYKFYASDDSAYINGITINKVLTINGNGYTIDGSNSAKIFDLHAAVTVNNLNFVNALGSNGGARTVILKQLLLIPMVIEVLLIGLEIVQVLFKLKIGLMLLILHFSICVLILILVFIKLLILMIFFILTLIALLLEMVSIMCMLMIL